MLRIEIGYPDRSIERDVLNSHRSGEPVERIGSVLTADDIVALQKEARAVTVEESINDYILDIVHATREHPELSLGVSTRGALTLYRATQSLALVEGRDFVIPDDVKRLAVAALAHRVMCGGLIREGQRQRAQIVIEQILSTVTVPS